MKTTDMTTSTIALRGFLTARYAEDEAAARRAMLGDDGHWQLSDYVGGERAPAAFAVDDLGRVAAACHAKGEPDQWGRGGHRETANHIARHDPARVLAECKARRRIVARAIKLTDWDEMGSSTRDDGLAILVDLASAYADHPDFRPEWRP